MGRGRTEIKRIENPTQRQSTFYKRRDGLYEMATNTKIWKDYHLERNAEIEKVEKLCELMEKELRFMKVDDREHYTLPTLDMLEHNLEAAISKVRSEKERKMGGEINFLENMVRDKQEERFGLSEKLAQVQTLKNMGGGSTSFSHGLDLKLDASRILSKDFSMHETKSSEFINPFSAPTAILSCPM
ncbi:MADS-box transcription factor 32 [Ananas comosus]|uniref:MADS-box transcription factor 32 n=1 Tax=Ananas comosus TaxID=4615 RepID=A0A199VLT8_ANACO|nr:MADS-box transcription factor 32 [Ananas comosus]